MSAASKGAADFFVPQRASRNATARAASCGSASAVQCAAARFAKCYGSCRVVRHPLLPCAALQPFVATRLCLCFRLHLPASNPAAPSRPRLPPELAFPSLLGSHPVGLPPCLPPRVPPCRALPRLPARALPRRPAAPSRSRPAAPSRAFPRRISPFLRSNRSISSLFAGNLEKSSF